MGQSGVILLDTHVVIWIAEGGARLSQRARAAIDAALPPRGGMGICDITLAELATAYGKRRLALAVPLHTFLDETEARFAIFPITARACARSVLLPSSYPRDPADRIIGATALVQGIPLVTADRLIRRSKAVPTIW